MDDLKKSAEKLDGIVLSIQRKIRAHPSFRIPLACNARRMENGLKCLSTYLQRTTDAQQLCR